MYAINTTVKTITGEKATILESNTVYIENEDGSFCESTTYTVNIKGQGTVEIHESKVLGNA
jgi:hypothetical protein